MRLTSIYNMVNGIEPKRVLYSEADTGIDGLDNLDSLDDILNDAKAGTKKTSSKKKDDEPDIEEEDTPEPDDSKPLLGKSDMDDMFNDIFSDEIADNNSEGEENQDENNPDINPEENPEENPEDTNIMNPDETDMSNLEETEADENNPDINPEENPDSGENETKKLSEEDEEHRSKMVSNKLIDLYNAYGEQTKSLVGLDMPADKEKRIRPILKEYTRIVNLLYEYITAHAKHDTSYIKVKRFSEFKYLFVVLDKQLGIFMEEDEKGNKKK